MPFKKYNKILSYLDKDWVVREECEWILSWTVYIQENHRGQLWVGPARYRQREVAGQQAPSVRGFL